MNRIKRCLVALLSFLPAGCHFVYSGPILWNHKSSAAFDAWVVFWIIDIALIIWMFALSVIKEPNK